MLVLPDQVLLACQQPSLVVSQLLKEQTLLLPEQVLKTSNTEPLNGSVSAVEGAAVVAARRSPRNVKRRASEGQWLSC